MAGPSFTACEASLSASELLDFVPHKMGMNFVFLFPNSLLKNSPGEGYMTHDFRGNHVGRVPPRGARWDISTGC
jgi:hypothetical protein